MGYMRHHTIVVTADEEHTDRIRSLAVQLFNTTNLGIGGEKANLVSEVIKASVNGYSSFFIAPDGSKEGWTTSDNGDLARSEFLNKLRNMKEDGIPVDWVEVQFADDNSETKVTSHSDE